MWSYAAMLDPATAMALHDLPNCKGKPLTPDTPGTRRKLLENFNDPKPGALPFWTQPNKQHASPVEMVREAVGANGYEPGRYSPRLRPLMEKCAA
jgi:hypothetical protein